MAEVASLLARIVGEAHVLAGTAVPAPDGLVVSFERIRRRSP